jgi:hypothetical protein
MSTVAYSDHDLYTQITTGALGTSCAPFVTEGGSAGIAGILGIVNNIGGAGAAFEADIPHDDMQQGDLAALPDYGEWALMTDNQISTWNSIVSTQVVKVGATNIQDGFAAAFANAPNCKAALAAIATQKGSWAQGRYGKYDATGQLLEITSDQVQNALTNH